MNPLTWPLKPFYFQSKLNDSNLALTASGSSVMLRTLEATPDFLWTATPDQRGGAFLKHLGTGLFLTAHWLEIVPGVKLPTGPLQMATQDLADPLQLWRYEKLDDGSNLVSPLESWDDKVNVWNGDVNTIALHKFDGDNNPKFLVIEETGVITVTSIDYAVDLAKADLSLPPTSSEAYVYENHNSAVDNSMQRTLEVTTSTSRTFSRSESKTDEQKYSQSFEIKSSDLPLVEVTASATIEQSTSKTTTFGEEDSSSQSETISVAVNMAVPAHKDYKYQLTSYSGKCSVPYTAHLSFQSALPGMAPRTYTSQGVFEGVNLTKCEICVYDVTKGDSNPPVVQNNTVPKDDLKIVATPKAAAQV